MTISKTETESTKRGRIIGIGASVNVTSGVNERAIQRLQQNNLWTRIVDGVRIIFKRR